MSTWQPLPPPLKSTQQKTIMDESLNKLDIDDDIIFTIEVTMSGTYLARITQGGKLLHGREVWLRKGDSLNMRVTGCGPMTYNSSIATLDPASPTP